MNTDTNLQLYLLIGQSNMAGRGVVEPQDRQTHPRVLALDRAGQWIPAADSALRPPVSSADGMPRP